MRVTAIAMSKPVAEQDCIVLLQALSNEYPIHLLLL